MKRSTVIEVISLMFIILFLYTALSKLMDYTMFKEQIRDSPLAPVAGLVTVLLPVTEIVVAVILFIPRTRPAGLYASLALMLLFTGYILYILSFNENLPCTCGGVLESLSWKEHLVFNAVFIVLGLIAIVLQRSIRQGVESRQDYMVHNYHE